MELTKGHSRTKKRIIEVDVFIEALEDSHIFISQTLHQSMLMPMKPEPIHFMGSSY